MVVFGWGQVPGSKCLVTILTLGTKKIAHADQTWKSDHRRGCMDDAVAYVYIHRDSVTDVRDSLWRSRRHNSGTFRTPLLFRGWTRFVYRMWRGASRRAELLIGNESVPIQLTQCWFPGLAISNAKIWTYFSHEIYGSNFITNSTGKMLRFEVTKTLITL